MWDGARERRGQREVARSSAIPVARVLCENLVLKEMASAGEVGAAGGCPKIGPAARRNVVGRSPIARKRVRVPGTAGKRQ